MSLLPDSLWVSLPVPALLLDGDDLIRAINPAAELFLNASARALRGASIWDRVLADAPLRESFARVRDSHAPLFVNDVEVGAHARAGRPCNLQIAPVAEMPGQILLLLEPREIADKLGRAMQAKTAARSAIGMAEMLAHEIKNPLAGITGAAQLLSMGLAPRDQELTDLIVGESRRIVKLLEQVEQFGDLRRPQRRALNLHDLLDRARTSAMVGFAAHMRLKEDYDPSLPLTHADGDQLLQVLLNLLRNAAEASPSGGTITLRTFYDPAIRVRRKDGIGAAVPLQIEIIDDGPGLPPDIAGEVFEPFVSGRENGTGLGLALVAKIVAEHEGWLAVESAPGRTVFRLSLPVAPKPGADPDGQAREDI